MCSLPERHTTNLGTAWLTSKELGLETCQYPYACPRQSWVRPAVCTTRESLTYKLTTVAAVPIRLLSLTLRNNLHQNQSQTPTRLRTSPTFWIYQMVAGQLGWSFLVHGACHFAATAGSTVRLPGLPPVNVNSNTLTNSDLVYHV